MRPIVRLLVALFALICATNAFAQTYTYSVYIDSDNNAATGCTVALSNATLSGVESVLTATVSAGSPPTVTSVTRSTCSGGGFGAPVAAGNGSVGVGAGDAGTTAIELIDSLTALAGSSASSVRLYAVAQSATGIDVLLTTDGSAGGAPIVLAIARPAPAVPAPLIGLPAVLLLIAGLLAFGSRAVRHRMLKRVLLGLVMFSGVAGAAIFNWSGISPIATDPAGDATSGESAIDIRFLSAVVANGNLNFRIDVVGGLVPSPPVAAADSYVASVGAALDVAAPGLLANDQLGTPTASIASFGGGNLGGTVADHAAGTSASLAGGTLAVDANGVLALTAPTTAGTYTFQYQLSNSQGSSAATVTIQINQAPTITSANAATFTVGTAGTFTVTTSGTPSAAIALGGAALPGGVSFVDNGNGTGTLSGTPAAGTGGTYAITFTPTNSQGTGATQAFTLTVNQAPAITSASAATFTVGTFGTFTVTTSGTPAATIARGGVALPGGVSFVDNGNGTGTLSGTPAASTGGTYAITFTPSNSQGSGTTQAFTLTVNQAPAITSASAATFTVGTAGTFTVTTSGTPSAAIALGGAALPGGVSFVDNGNGTGTLSGTPAANTGGTYAITFTPSNSVGTGTAQSFTLTIDEAPAITSASTATFTVGTAGTFTVTTSGTPVAAIASGGAALPGGVSFVDNGNGTGTLSGTPAVSTSGTYAITFTPTNSVGTGAAQSFTLTVTDKPTISSAGAATFTVGTAGTFTVTTSGTPAATIARGGAALPGGVSFIDNGNGTGTLSGTPTASAGGTYAITFTPTNSVGTGATQAFTLTVDQAPAITSANAATFTAGTAGTFTFSATGFPAPTFSLGGALPSGITFNSSAGTLGGTPAASTGGNYALTLTASNGVSPNASQSFTLTVDEAPKFTSTAAATFIVGVPASATVSAGGFPIPTVALNSGSLPTGIGFTGGSGSGTLAGTPGAGSFAGSPYTLTFGAGNGVNPDASQSFTLNVQCPSMTLTGTLTNGLYEQAYSQAFGVSGGNGSLLTWSTSPSPLVTGVSINSSSGTVAGTPANTVVENVTVTATDAFGCAVSQTFNNFTVAPVASPETYDKIVGNTQFVITGTTTAPATPYVDGLNLAGSGFATLIANDQGPGTLSVSPNGVPIVTNHGGSVTIQADGSFVYTPKVGDAWTTDDSFTYAIVDGNGIASMPATVTLARGVTQTVWYVNGMASATGSGLSSDPFKAVGSAGTPHVAGDVIFVESSNSSATVTAGAISLKSGVTLWGQGMALPTNGTTIAGFNIPIDNTAAVTNKPVLNGTVTLTGSNAIIGALDISTAGVIGLTNTGALTGIGVGNAVTVTTTGQAAVALNGVSGTLAFLSISASGGANGISLTGTGGSFAVLGNGANARNGSGGSISGTSGAGVLLSNAAGVSLRQMNIALGTNTTANGIDAALAGTTLALNYMAVIGPGGTSAATGNDIALNSIGSLQLTNSAISNAANDGLQLNQFGGTLAASTLYGNTFSGNTQGYGVHVQTSGTGAIAGFNLGGTGTGQPNTFTNNGIGASIEYAALNSATTGNVVFSVSGNTFNNPTAGNTFSNAINVSSNGTYASTGGTITGKIANNTIGTIGTLDSGSAIGDGVRVQIEGGVHGVFTISGNAINEVPNAQGIELHNYGGTGGAGGLNVNFVNNTISTPTGSAQSLCGTPGACPFAGLWFTSETGGSVCSIVNGNSVFDASPLGGIAGYELDQTGTFRIEGTNSTALAQVTATNQGYPSASPPIVSITGTISVVAANTCGVFP